MANEVRGEIDIEVQGATYTIKPTFNCIVEIEKLCGGSILNIPQHFSISSLAKIFYSAIREANKQSHPSVNEVGSMLTRRGLNWGIETINKFLVPIMQGTDNAPEDVKEAAEKKPEESQSENATG